MQKASSLHLWRGICCHLLDGTLCLLFQYLPADQGRVSAPALWSRPMMIEEAKIAAK